MVQLDGIKVGILLHAPHTGKDLEHRLMLDRRSMGTPLLIPPFLLRFLKTEGWNVHPLSTPNRPRSEDMRLSISGEHLETGDSPSSCNWERRRLQA